LPWNAARQLVRLAREATEIGPGSEASREHLVGGVVRLIGAEFGMFVIDPAFMRAGKGPLRHITACGFEASIIPGLDMVIDVGRESHPLLASIIRRREKQGTAEIVTMDRSRMVSDSEWYGSAYVSERLRPARYDDWLVSCRSHGEHGDISGLGMVRAWGDPPFDEEQAALLELFHCECDSLLTPRPTFSLEESLSPRVRQTLACLLTGAADKEIASDLQIGVHTVREYVKKIFKTFDVHSRAQLIARVARDRDPHSGNPANDSR
jgi:DNA-binding CsgD family transcriptional regulator